MTRWKSSRESTTVRAAWWSCASSQALVWRKPPRCFRYPSRLPNATGAAPKRGYGASFRGGLPQMSPERWQRVKELFDLVLRLDASERDAYLDRSCDGDTDLRDEVVSLIEAYQDAGDILEPRSLPRSDAIIGTLLGPYRIAEHIGDGGMGAVYRALRADDVFEKEVAVKVVRRGLDLDYMVRHFRLERQIMASLDHPNIARLLDGGATPDGLPYFVMEFIRGQAIDAYCNQYKLDLRARLALFRAVCGAVEFAHRLGVVHRDIKPGNILVT